MVVKLHVWTTVNTRKVNVNDAASFVLACNAPESTVEVIKNVTCRHCTEEYDSQS